MNCSDVQKKLFDYYNGKLSLEEYKNVGSHIAMCQRCEKQFDKIANSHIEKGAADNKKTLKRRPLYLGSIVILIVALSVVFYQIFLSSNQAVFGEAVNVQTVDEDVQLTITHVAASDEETILFYEIHNLKNEEPTLIEGNSVYEEETALNYPINRISVRNVEIVSPRITKGQIHLPAMKDDEKLMVIEINEVFQLQSDLIELHSAEWYDPQNRVVVDGEWRLEVPIKKYETKTHELNQIIEVEGVPVELLTLVMTPTSTELTYSYKRDNSNDHNHEIQLSHFVANGKRYEVKNYQRGVVDFELPYIQTAKFEGMYFQNLKNIEVHFGMMVQFLNNQVKIDFDYKNLPYTFEYSGEPITIESVEFNDNTTKMVLKEVIDHERSYNFLYIDVNYYRLSGYPFYQVDHTFDVVWFDRENNKIDEEDSGASLPQYEFYPTNPQTEYRFFSTEQTIEVKWEEEDIPFIPTYIYIQAYTKAIMLDDVVKIPIKKK